MRCVQRFVGLSLFAWLCATHALGCFFTLDLDHVDCDLYSHPGCSGGSGTGTGGGTSTECVPSENDKPVADTSGVFVSSSLGAEGNAGTKSTPLKSVQAAIDKAQGRPVYACAEPLSGSVRLARGSAIYGGLDCTKDWAYVGATTKSALMGETDKPAVTITKEASGAEIEDFAISAANATVKGGSSIAVAIDDVSAALVRCDVTAGDGMDGEDGLPPAGMAIKGANAPDPVPMTMNACINPNAVAGGAAGMTTCDDGVSMGGVGGKGGITGMSNGDGQKGEDGTPADGMNGLGGGGESASKCVNGTQSKDGDPGGPGEAGPASNSPEKLALTGLLGGSGGDGVSGTRGQGGGGGGGAKSGMFCTGGVDGNGASGGGGGAGGCGGKGGGGGKAGGSSIAILSLGTDTTVIEVSLATGKGGKGGNGAIGQGGGGFGLGTVGGQASGLGTSKQGCKGGDGGAGGAGGPGGGGRGGHAIGIAYASAPKTPAAVMTYTAGTPGSGGSGGPGASMSSNGASGAADKCWDFANKQSCAR